MIKKKTKIPEIKAKGTSSLNPDEDLSPVPFGSSRKIPKNRRAYGTNPRALGTNPRSKGTNPRAKRVTSKSNILEDFRKAWRMEQYMKGEE
jgi:hypothetical protein